MPSIFPLYHSTNHGGRSAVFTVPVQGGTPKLITPLAPSYLHGGSPDGKFLVYTGGRNNEYDIYRRAADGSGEEIRLTDFKGLDDGPEYSPDGKHIYYKQVYLRLMPVGGGVPKVIAYVYGGQGTINVPSWSPDSKMLAFVSNTDSSN